MSALTQALPPLLQQTGQTFKNIHQIHQNSFIDELQHVLIVLTGARTKTDVESRYLIFLNHLSSGIPTPGIKRLILDVATKTYYYCFVVKTSKVEVLDSNKNSSVN